MTTLALLRAYPGYARLWLAQAVSLAGDWFTLIGISVLVARGSGGSGMAVSALVLMQILPSILVGPLGGVLVDRFDRRRVLIASDLARAMLVPLFLLGASAERVWIVYPLAFLHFAIATVFEPGRTALVPDLVEKDDLVRATTLSTVTWSAMAAFGGAFGGAALSAVGLSAAFVIDSSTFLASAALIASISARAPPVPIAPAGEDVVGVRIRDGVRYALAHPLTAAALLIKAINGVAVIDTFLVLYGTRLFVRGEGGAASVGLLFACFGLGAVVGPPLFNRFDDGTPHRMRRLVAAAAVFICAGMFALAAAPSLELACLAAVVRGIGGCSTWTYSTIILQQTVPERLRGRLFAMDLAIAMLAASVSSVAWGWAIDRFGLRPVMLAAAVVSLVPMSLWTASLRWQDRR